MNRIHVVLSNMPGLLRDIVVDAIASEPDIEIAREIHSAAELERFLQTDSADLVLAADNDAAFAEDSRRVLSARALPRLLVLSESGSAAHLHWMRPETSPLGQLTPEGLVREIRAAARLERGWRSET